ncbi:MAG: UDP-N-acetylmuramoyl-L-alanyl-D-glutamate--2,6-diaminopimelate ligase [Ruminococcus sp.]|nr:UDP-N-acetylmuramoyl-L-alanyl-D-glutamate--2,6-diaminopimelate ligase [Ruminococcus sp.]
MKLYDLIHGIADTHIQNREIVSITDDSRKIQKDCIFVCVKGDSFDGHSKAKDAVNLGAIVVVDHNMNLDNQIIVPNTREFYGELCCSWFGNPEKKMKFIGVTGTNGKTTMTSVIKHILTDNGYKVGLIGTIQNEIGDEVIHTDNTTPFAFDLMALLDKMYRCGCDYVVMEVSSFGLVQHRIGAIHFDIAVFTNLTQDHLDYHKTMEDYYQAKKMLFDICDKAIVCIDDDYGVRLFNEISCEKYSYSITKEADFYAVNPIIKSNGTTFRFNTLNDSYDINMKMVGSFNVSNVTGVMGVCLAEEIPFENIKLSVENCNGVKGRCEIIPTGRDFSVICDYAHTPDAIENILKSVKEYTTGRLICLFGCGGNRDKTKRPLMCKSALKYADKLIITSDNPRDENPQEIINDILVALEGETSIPYDVVVDRVQAIHHAIKTAQTGDIIVLAGKGHEDYQILANNVHIYLDEREIVADALKTL